MKHDLDDVPYKKRQRDELLVGGIPSLAPCGC